MYLHLSSEALNIIERRFLLILQSEDNKLTIHIALISGYEK